MISALLPAGLYVEAPMDEASAAAWTTGDERRIAAEFRSERRRREYLTWRAIVRRELGAAVDIGYDGVGAPVLRNRSERIGVSHCDGRVAVCISARRCAVDVEPEGRDFLRVASHYLSSDEARLSGCDLLPGVVWCAKETLYKYSGREGLDLLRDLHVLEVDFAAGRILGRIAGGEPLTISLLRREGYLVTFIC